MQIPPLAPNEEDRLQDLHDYGILGTPPDQVLDHLAEMAARICGTPRAAVTIIDKDHQWFKATHGFSATPTPRDDSICGHGILEQGLFEVPDISEDPRFQGSSHIEGPAQVRFYAGSPLRSERGNAIGMLCVFDQNPRKLNTMQQAALNDLAELAMGVIQAGRNARLLSWFGSLLDTVDQEIFIMDPGTLQYIYANETALRSLSTDLAGLRRLTPMDILQERSREWFERHIQELHTGEPFIAFESRRKRADGQVYPVEVRWQLRVTNGRRVVLSVVQDISKRKALEHMKDELVAVVNHELRTPLTSIHGALKLLEAGAAGPLPEVAGELIGVAVQNSDRLRRIVDDILDMEKLASGRMEFHIELLDAGEVLAEIGSACASYAKSNRIKLYVDSPPGLQLQADGARLQQVMANLVSNAIKFSPPDAIVTLRAVPIQRGRVQLEVIDQGSGVPEQFRELIFQRFTQADMKANRSKGGSGLGLAIAKQMTERMGGKIGFESQPGKTRFFVAFPGATS